MGFMNLLHKKDTKKAQEPIDFCALKKQCYEADTRVHGAQETKVLIEKLGHAVLQLDEVYIPYDEDFKTDFPFITNEGRILVFSQKHIAMGFTAYFYALKLGHFTMRRFGKQELPDLFRSYREIGILALQLDCGADPVDIPLSHLVEQPSENLLEKYNVEIRGEFLRELQYTYRMDKLEESEHRANIAHTLKELVLTMRFNAFRCLSNSLCYALASTPYKPGCTLYTKAAIEKATALIDRAKLPKSCLIADGDKTYATYTPPINLCFTPRNGKEVFVFTGRKEAEIARKKLLEHGSDYSVVVVTFDELLSHAKQCNGIALDLPTYDRELFHKDIAELLQWRNYNGPIFVQLKKE